MGLTQTNLRGRLATELEYHIRLKSGSPVGLTQCIIPRRCSSLGTSCTNRERLFSVSVAMAIGSIESLPARARVKVDNPGHLYEISPLDSPEVAYGLGPSSIR